MAGLNAVELEGRLARDPIVSHNKTAFARATVACEVSFTNLEGRHRTITSYPNIIAFGENAEQLGGLSKGTLVHIRGYIATGNYVDSKTGRKIYTTDVNVQELQVITEAVGKKEEADMCDEASDVQIPF